MEALRRYNGSAQEEGALMNRAELGDNSNGLDHPGQSDASESGTSDYDDSSDDSEAQADNDSLCISSFPGPLDPGRMSLGSTERNYAVKIKAMVESEPELDNLSDFMYAQIAIVSLRESRTLTEDLPAVLERIEALQGLREELFIRDTLAHGIEMMTKVIALLPAWFLAFGYLQEKGSYLRVVNLTEFDMSLFTDPVKVRTWLAAVYYINHCHVPDLEAARQGFVQFIECQGYDWRNQNMFHIKAFSEAAPSFALYPILCSQTTHYHTGMFVRMLASMARRMLPKHLTEGFEFEADCEFGNLVEVFCLPDLAAANRRLLERLEDALIRRYENEKKFKLTTEGDVQPAN